MLKIILIHVKVNHNLNQIETPPMSKMNNFDIQPCLPTW